MSGFPPSLEILAELATLGSRSGTTSTVSSAGAVWLVAALIS